MSFAGNYGIRSTNATLPDVADAIDALSDGTLMGATAT